MMKSGFGPTRGASFLLSFAGALLFLPAIYLRADTLFLSNGGRIEGVVENQTGADIFLRTPEGLQRIPKNRIRRIEYEDLRKKAEEERNRELERQKREEERLRKELEDRRQAEEQARQAQEARDAERARAEKEEILQRQQEADRITREQDLAREQERVRIEKENALRRHGLLFSAFLGGGDLKPAALMLSHNLQSLMTQFGADRNYRNDPNPRPGITSGLEILYVWNRLSVALEGRYSGYRGSAQVYGEKDAQLSTGADVRHDLDSVDYSKILRNSIEMRPGFDVWVAPRFRLTVFAGARRQLTEVKGEQTGPGWYDVSSVLYYNKQADAQGTTLRGWLGGLGAEYRFDSFGRPSRVEFRVGGFSGVGKGHFETGGLVLGSGWVEQSDVAVRYDIRAAGPFGALTLRRSIADRLEIGLGFYYESLLFRPQTLDVSSKSHPMNLSDWYNVHWNTAIIHDYYQDRTRAREIHRSVDFSVRYHLDFRG